MKVLVQLIAPTLKALIGVVSVLVGLGWGAYAAVSLIARTEAGLVRDEIKMLRSADLQHLDKRFDRLEVLIKEKK